MAEKHEKLRIDPPQIRSMDNAAPTTRNSEGERVALQVQAGSKSLVTMDLRLDDGREVAVRVRV